MLAAAARSRRDTPVQGWLFNDALNRGDYGDALTYADAMMRVSLGLCGEVLTNLLAFIGGPRGSHCFAGAACARPRRGGASCCRTSCRATRPPDVVFSCSPTWLWEPIRRRTPRSSLFSIG